MRRAKDFMLFDLMVAISLIALLAVVFIPSLQFVHTSYSYTETITLFGVMDVSDFVRKLKENTEMDFSNHESEKSTEYWIVLSDPNSGPKLVMFEKWRPGVEEESGSILKNQVPGS